VTAVTPTVRVMPTANQLGEFLRSRRESVRLEEVGLPGGERRRVRGLRREEVALLAGVSADYYLRLEQGRDRRPSDQVLHSIVRALRLDQDGYTYLVELARPKSPARRRPRVERAGTGIQNLHAFKRLRTR